MRKLHDVFMKNHIFAAINEGIILALLTNHGICGSLAYSSDVDTQLEMLVDLSHCQI